MGSRGHAQRATDVEIASAQPSGGLLDWAQKYARQEGLLASASFQRGMGSFMAGH